MRKRLVVLAQEPKREGFCLRRYLSRHRLHLWIFIAPMGRLPHGRDLNHISEAFNLFSWIFHGLSVGVFFLELGLPFSVAVLFIKCSEVLGMHNSAKEAEMSSSYRTSLGRLNGSWILKFVPA